MWSIDPRIVEPALALLAAIALAALGWLTGTGLAPLVLGLAGYLGWTLYQLYRLALWMEHPKRERAPARVGLFVPLLEATSNLRSRGKNRKKRLRDILGGFQESTSALPDATVVMDENWIVEWSNKVASEYLGIHKPKDQPRSIFEYIDDRVFREYVDGGDYSRPLQIPGPLDYSISLEVRVVPYGKGKHLIQARDITRLNQLENVRRDFVANVSHELRTPLTVVHGYLESMLEADDDDEMDQWKPILDQMHSQSTRLQRIVEDLLTLSRLETRDRSEGFESFPVCDMIDRIARGAASLGGDNRHQIEVDCDPELGLAGSPSEIESAFSNLVFNAVRYTPAGGTIQVRWFRDGWDACFEVADSGVGIEARHIPRLTERFYRVDVGRSREKGGTGLGLAIVKHVLIRHGGRLKIESEPGVGSTFTCWFPPERVRPQSSTDGALSA